MKQPIDSARNHARAAALAGREAAEFSRGPDEALSFIVKEGNRAGEVVGQIRALIRRHPHEKTRVEINDAILEVIALTRCGGSKQ